MPESRCDHKPNRGYWTSFNFWRPHQKDTARSGVCLCGNICFSWMRWDGQAGSKSSSAASTGDGADGAVSWDSPSRARPKPGASSGRVYSPKGHYWPTPQKKCLQFQLQGPPSYQPNGCRTATLEAGCSEQAMFDPDSSCGAPSTQKPEAEFLNRCSASEAIFEAASSLEGSDVETCFFFEAASSHEALEKATPPKPEAEFLNRSKVGIKLHGML